MSNIPTIQAQVEFSRAFSDLQACDTQLAFKTSIHSQIDPITQQRQITVYTDDGNGNGVEVFTVILESAQ